MAKKASQTKITPNAGKAKPMAKTAASTKPIAKAEPKVFVVAKAINKIDGRKAVEGLCKSQVELDVLEMDVQKAKMAKGTALALMTKVIYDAAKADNRINLAVLSAPSATKAEKNILNDRLRVALNIVELTVGEDGAERRNLSDWAMNVFPRPGEKKTDSEEAQARETNRANFGQQLRAAANAAATLVAKDVAAEIDKATGLLAISGKEVKQHFAQDKVILNEKQNFQVGSTEVNLKAKPSISEVARWGGAITPPRGPASPTVNPANNEQVKDRLDKFREGIIDKLATFNDDVATALDALRDAIDNAIARNEAAAKAPAAKKTA